MITKANSIQNKVNSDFVSTFTTHILIFKRFKSQQITNQNKLFLVSLISTEFCFFFNQESHYNKLTYAELKKILINTMFLYQN
jgi:hypothetical protein